MTLELLYALLFLAPVAMSGWWCCCQCQHCRGAYPKELEVTIAGLTDRDCSECNTLNDTFVLQWVGEGASGCCWQYELDPLCDGSFDVIIACIDKPIGLGYQLEVSISRASGGLEVITFLADLGETKPRCRDWSGLDVPVTTQIQTECHDDSSTCTVNAV